MNKLFIISLIFLSSCATKYIECFDCEQDVAKYDHSCPEVGHGACPICEENIFFEKNLLTNSLK